MMVWDDLVRGPIVVVKDFKAHLTESGCQQAGTGELAASEFPDVMGRWNSVFEGKTHELQHVFQVIGNANFAHSPTDYGFALQSSQVAGTADAQVAALILRQTAQDHASSHDGFH